MILIVSVICTLFILLLVIFVLRSRARNQQALSRRMRYYAGDMAQKLTRAAQQFHQSFFQRFTYFWLFLLTSHIPSIISHTAGQCLLVTGTRP